MNNKPLDLYLNFSSKFSPKVIGHLAMLLFSLIVAGSFSFGKLIAGDIDPIALTAVRFAVAAVLLGIVLGATGKLKWRDYSQPWRHLVLGGVFIIFFILMFESLKTATAITTAAIFTLMLFMAGAMDKIVNGRRQTRWVSLALCFGVFGALWVVFCFLSLDRCFH
jgi:drug/metabolite transporter (DMT)-like permease